VVDQYSTEEENDSVLQDKALRQVFPDLLAEEDNVLIDQQIENQGEVEPEI
jgi:hypothetical protein